MCVGTLHSRLVLDEPDKIHYGRDSSIAGRVILSYSRSTTRRSKSLGTANTVLPLFGPLVVDLVFQGVINTDVGERNTASIESKDDTVFLSTRQRVHDGSFFIESGESFEIPFVMPIPANIDSRNQTQTQCRRDSAGSWRFTNISQPTEEAPLPPTCETFNRRGMGDRSLASISYLLKTTTMMPGIDVQIEAVPGETTGAPAVNILYECARPAQPPLGNTIYMGSHVTISPQRESSGIKNKARALIRPSASPHIFELFCSQIPREMCLGTTFQCCVGVRATNPHHSDGEGGTSLPDVRLDRLTAQIVQHTSVKADSRWASKERPKDVQVVQTMAVASTALPIILRPSSSSRTTTSTAIAIVRTAQPLSGMSSSFTFGPLTRMYKLRLELQITCAGEIRTVRRDLDITIHPPVADDDDDDDDELFSAHYYSPANRIANDERLPGYREAMSEPSPPLDEFAMMPPLIGVGA